jgi:hypothetical protein
MKRSKHMSGWSRATWRWMVPTMLLMWGSGLLLWVWPAETVMTLSDLLQRLRHSAVVLHGVLTWWLCVLCGRGVWPHLRVIWQRRDALANWAWGLVSFVALCVVAAAGLLLLYGPASLHDGASELHGWLGVVLPALLLAHVWRRWMPSRA